MGVRDRRIGNDRRIVSITVHINERRKAGRPRRFDAPLSKKMWFRLTDEEDRNVRAVAKMNQQSLTDFVRDAVVSACADCTDEPVLRGAA